MMDFMIDVIKDSFFDSMKLLPLLFAIYLIVEYLEHKNNGAVHGIFNKSKNIGPLLGGVFGIIPQCGFSVIASELFAKHAITLGFSFPHPMRQFRCCLRIPKCLATC